MIEQVIYLPQAAEDVADAYDWYENQEEGLGREFLRCIDACVSNIRRHPLFHPIAADDFRRALVRRFPYIIFYEVTEGGIFIYSVFHSSMNPARWKKRLGKRD